jgi:hypothetical protein
MVFGLAEELESEFGLGVGEILWEETVAGKKHTETQTQVVKEKPFEFCFVYPFLPHSGT